MRSPVFWLILPLMLQDNMAVDAFLNVAEVALKDFCVNCFIWYW